jgi:hypothetical protein
MGAQNMWLNLNIVGRGSTFFCGVALSQLYKTTCNNMWKVVHTMQSVSETPCSPIVKLQANHDLVAEGANSSKKKQSVTLVPKGISKFV